MVDPVYRGGVDTDENDFWPGHYSRTHVGAVRQDHTSVLDAIRAGRVWVDHGGLVDSIDARLVLERGRTIPLGGTLIGKRDRRVTVTADIMTASRPNRAGFVPELARVDVIVGRIDGPAADRDSMTAPATRVAAQLPVSRLTAIPGGYRLSQEIAVPGDRFYVRLRGTDGKRQPPGSSARRSTRPAPRSTCWATRTRGRTSGSTRARSTPSCPSRGRVRPAPTRRVGAGVASEARDHLAAVHERARADDRAVRREAGGHDARLGHEAELLAEGDGLADHVEEVGRDAAEPAADRHDVEVHERAGGRDGAADGEARATDSRDGRLVAVAVGGREVLAGGSRPALRARPRDALRPRRDGLDAPLAAARARVVEPGDLDVADVAGVARGSRRGAAPSTSPPPIPVETIMPITWSWPRPAPTQCSARVMARPSICSVVGTSGVSSARRSRSG